MILEATRARLAVQLPLTRAMLTKGEKGGWGGGEGGLKGEGDKLT